VGSILGTASTTDKRGMQAVDTVRVANCYGGIQGIIAKFQRPYIGPFKINLIVNPYLYEIHDAQSNVKGLHHVSHLKPYANQCSEL
jgi:hypothetical protein